MDFDDLLYLPAMALRDIRGLRAELDARFQYVLIDEYQDTNLAQYAPAAAAHRRAGNLAVVGDDASAIFSFRGADVRNILEFEKDFPEAAHGQAGAKLPLYPDDPLGCERCDLAQPRQPGEEPLDRGGRGRERSSSPSSTTSTPRRATSPARSRALPRRRLPGRDRRLLPDQRPGAGCWRHHWSATSCPTR